MYQLNKKLSKDMMAFADRLKEHRSKDLIVPTEMPLRLEKRGVIFLPAGKGYVFSMGLIESTLVGTSFNILMKFFILDRREDPNQSNPLLIYPALYRDNYGTQEVSCSYGLQHIGKINIRLQKEHAFFAEKWLYHLKATGYLRRK